MLRKIRDTLGKIVIGIGSVGFLACFIIMTMTTSDVLLRRFGIGALLGSNEVTEMLMVLTMAFGIPALHVVRGHVKVDFFVDMIPGRGKCFFLGFIRLAESAILGLLIWGTYEKVRSLIARPLYSMIIRIPQFPFAVCLCLGMVLFSILLFMDALIYITDGVNYQKNPAAHNGQSV